jgi:hypothetical protein
LYGCSFLPARRQLILRIRLREKSWKRFVNIKGILAGEKKNQEKKSLIAGPYHDGTVKFSFYFKDYR